MSQQTLTGESFKPVGAPYANAKNLDKLISAYKNDIIILNSEIMQMQTDITLIIASQCTADARRYNYLERKKEGIRYLIETRRDRIKDIKDTALEVYGVDLNEF